MTDCPVCGELVDAHSDTEAATCEKSLSKILRAIESRGRLRRETPDGKVRITKITSVPEERIVYRSGGFAEGTFIAALVITALLVVSLMVCEVVP